VATTGRFEGERVTRYEITLSNAAKVEMTAATINLGLNKLWFFDSDNNLIGVFVWKEVAGFRVIGDAGGQQFTDALLHEEKSKTQEQTRTEAEKGVFFATAESVGDLLISTDTQVRTAWVKMFGERKKAKRKGSPNLHISQVTGVSPKIGVERLFERG
jgi:hypothetical protein